MLLKIQLLQLQNIPRDLHSHWGFIITWANTWTPKAHLLTLHLNPFCLLCSSSFSSDMVGREKLTQTWYGQRCRHAARQREICLVLDTLEILYRILHIMLHFSSNAPFLLFYIRSWERKENMIVTPFSSPSILHAGQVYQVAKKPYSVQWFWLNPASCTSRPYLKDKIFALVGVFTPHLNLYPSIAVSLCWVLGVTWCRFEVRFDIIYSWWS